MMRRDRVWIAIMAVIFSAAIFATGNNVIRDLHQINHRAASRAVPAGKWHPGPGLYEFNQVAKANP